MNNAVSRFEWERAALGASINAEAKVVMWAYAMYGSDGAVEIWPSIKTITEDTGYSKDKVARTRNELITAGWLTPSGNYTSNGGEKLYLTKGESNPTGYLASGVRRISKKSQANLVPGARHLSGKSRDTCLDNPEDLSGKSNNSALEYQDRTTKNNHLEETDRTTSSKTDAPVLANAPTVTLNEVSGIKEESETETFSCLREDYVPVVHEGVTYFLTLEGVTSTVADAPVENDSISSKSKKQAVEVDETKEGYKRLLHLLREARASEARTKEAFDFFFDKSWKPQKTGDHRASAAVMYSNEPKVAAGSWLG